MESIMLRVLIKREYYRTVQEDRDGLHPTDNKTATGMELHSPLDNRQSVQNIEIH